MNSILKFSLTLFAIIVSLQTFGQNGFFTDYTVFTDYVYKNTQYSLMDYLNKSEGKAMYQFETDSAGNIQNLQLLTSDCSLTLINEAKRLIYDSPQNKRERNAKIKVTINFKFSDNIIYKDVKEPPRFIGGDKKLLEFINKNLNFPPEAADNAIQGRVICGFVIEKDGSIRMIEIIRSVDKLLDAEAVRVIARMPKWQAGRQNGKPVRVYYTLPINFKLQ
ncbi:MAG: TonB family protein [Paludibacter sp.]|jgi:TonB family protein|nr:TonB family protein [Paludibacter sp.]